MILHLFNDEKVVSRTIEYFECALEGLNRYIVLIPSFKYNCKYVSENRTNVFFVVYGTNDFWEIVGDVADYEEIILHFLDDNKVDFVNSISHSCITWIEWGADLYNTLLCYRGFNLFLNSNEQRKAGLLTWKRKYLLPLCKMKDRKRLNEWIRSIKKISFIVALEEEILLLKEYYPEFDHLKRKSFYYYPVDDILSTDFGSLWCIGNNIMVGNSASLTGNHVYIFKKLSLLELENRKVKVPLSYGNAKRYLIEQGKKYLPEQFDPILDFLSLDDYNEQLLDCNVFIYANLRQEALGNILIALYIGGMVFLDSTNPLYHYFKSIGVVVYSIQDLSNGILVKPLALEIRKNNRKIVGELYSQKRLLMLIKNEFGNN